MRNLKLFFVFVFALALEGCMIIDSWPSYHFRSNVAPMAGSAYDIYYDSNELGGAIADDGEIVFGLRWLWMASPTRICVYRDSVFYGIYDLYGSNSPSLAENNQLHVWIYDYASAEMTKANYRGVVQIDFGKDMRGASRAEAMRDTCEAIRIRAHAPCVTSRCELNGGTYNPETGIGVFRHVRKVQ